MPTFRDFLRGLTGPRTEAERVREQARLLVIAARTKGEHVDPRTLEAAGLCTHCEGTGRSYSTYGDGDCYFCRGTGEMRNNVEVIDPEQIKRIMRGPSGPFGP